MKKFHIKAILALLSLASVFWLSWEMLDSPELSNKTEVGILLGVLASACGIAFKYLFESDDDDHHHQQKGEG